MNGVCTYLAILCDLKKDTFCRKMKTQELKIRQVKAVCEYLRLTGEEANELFFPKKKESARRETSNTL